MAKKATGVEVWTLALGFGHVCLHFASCHSPTLVSVTKATRSVISSKLSKTQMD